MGRTLHYEMRPNHKVVVTEQDWDKIRSLTDTFYSKFKWTCECVGFDSLNFYPRWKRCFVDSKLPSDLKGWEFVCAERDKLRANGMSQLEITKELHRRKLISYYTDDNRENLQVAKGFTKVTGNEFNAFLVVAWLTEISRILPHHEFLIHDEGKFLLLDIIIKNGKAHADHKSIKADLTCYRKKIEQGESVNAYKKLFDKKLALQHKFTGKAWKDVSHFCRSVNPEDFDENPEFNATMVSLARCDSQKAFQYVLDLLTNKGETNNVRKT